MSEFQVHTPESAPAASRPTLLAAGEKVGFVPNLYGVLAESPTALEAYTTLSAIVDRSSLTSVQRHVVLLTVSRENGCGYCVAAHSTLAVMGKVPAEILAALRRGEPLPNARLEALRAFTAAVVAERGWAGGQPLDAFLAAGFDRAAVLDVVAAVAMKTLSN
jgi:uncharacterized peroxidase-related enzyme